jgi:hypothetical protein
MEKNIASRHRYALKRSIGKSHFENKKKQKNMLRKKNPAK